MGWFAGSFLNNKFHWKHTLNTSSIFLNTRSSSCGRVVFGLALTRKAVDKIWSLRVFSALVFSFFFFFSTVFLVSILHYSSPVDHPFGQVTTSLPWSTYAVLFRFTVLWYLAAYVLGGATAFRFGVSLYRLGFLIAIKKRCFQTLARSRMSSVAYFLDTLLARLLNEHQCYYLPFSDVFVNFCFMLLAPLALQVPGSSRCLQGWPTPLAEFALFLQGRELASFFPANGLILYLNRSFKITFIYPFLSSSEISLQKSALFIPFVKPEHGIFFCYE